MVGQAKPHHPAKHSKALCKSSLSSGLGVTSPLGWLCSKRKLTAPTRAACRKISRGDTSAASLVPIERSFSLIRAAFCRLATAESCVRAYRRPLQISACIVCRRSGSGKAEAFAPPEGDPSASSKCRDPHGFYFADSPDLLQLVAR